VSFSWEPPGGGRAVPSKKVKAERETKEEYESFVCRRVYLRCLTNAEGSHGVNHVGKEGMGGYKT